MLIKNPDLKHERDFGKNILRFERRKGQQHFFEFFWMGRTYYI